MMRSRPQSLHSFVFLLAIAAAACGPASPSHAVTLSTSSDSAAAMNKDESGIRSVGTNDPTKDVAAVQDAVNSSAKVRLVGTFDFGESGQVILRNDIEIAGEGATIKGGRSSLYSPLPASLPVQTPGPAISIHGLTFDGARYAPIEIEHTRALEISHNRVMNVVPIGTPPGTPYPARHGGFMLGRTASALPQEDLVGAFAGNVVVHHNVLDMSGSGPRDHDVPGHRHDARMGSNRHYRLQRDLGVLPQRDRDDRKLQGNGGQHRYFQ